jgi:serine/threonine protein kinase
MIPDSPLESVLTGRRFDVYELHELIGAGAMGEVYRATDTSCLTASASSWSKNSRNRARPRAGRS